jgi:hypothetical protein
MNEFETMLKTATKQREQLIAERNELSRKIAALDKTIEGLSAVCEPPAEEPPAVSQALAQTLLKYAGLTVIVKMALQASAIRLSASNIVSLLEKVGYPLDRFDNPRANVTTVLSRLHAAGDVGREPGPEVTYRWIGGTSTLSPDFNLLAAIKNFSELVKDEKKDSKNQMTPSEKASIIARIAGTKKTK